MVQYLTRQEKDFLHLDYALKNYEPLNLLISTTRQSEFVSGYILRDLNKQKLSFKTKKGLELYLDGNFFFKFPLKQIGPGGFRIEYRDEKNLEIYDNQKNPTKISDEAVYSTTLRQKLDGLMLEISFLGKIPLVKDGSKGRFWTLSEKFVDTQLDLKL